MFWGAFQYAEDIHQYPGVLTSLKRTNTVFYGVRGLKMEKLPALLEAKLEETGHKPNRLIIHVGKNDIHSTVSINQLMEKASKMSASLFHILRSRSLKATVFWSDVIPHCSYKTLSLPYGDMLVNNLNAVAQMCMVIKNHAFISHHLIKPNMIHLFRRQMVTTDPVHISPAGYRVWLKNFDLALRQHLLPVPLMEVSLGQGHVVTSIHS